MLFEVDPIYLHYMTDRQEQFDLKISKVKILWKQRHLHLGCPWGKLKHTKINFKVNFPFKCGIPQDFWSSSEQIKIFLMKSELFLTATQLQL